jgi:hypothetical protein
MRRSTNPLTLDPFSPIGMGPTADISSTTGPLALEPLSPQSGEVEELLHHLDSWPYLHIERQSDCAILRMHDLVVGKLNLAMRAVSVNVPPDATGPRLASDPLVRRTTDGISVHVTDIESRTTAETLLRWRVDLERFAPQLGVASP